MAKKVKVTAKSASKAATPAHKKAKHSVLKSKSVSHKKAVTEINKMLTDAFWINRTLGNTMDQIAGVDPFVFVITIEVNPAITIVIVNVNGVRAKQEDFKVEDGKITCTVKAMVSTLDFLLIIEATGEPETETSFNLTCDGQKVFSSDKKIRITGTGKGSFSEQNVPLP
ncbi:MAG: hypothetical protein P0Y53_18695 [Candidatus Pseudobacter hemicellulosilyticus]|uniref:Uncharacterized protein n=1 Tax=Candidatus Pseudobacter hemicellulosilyticus TaxID=3121375 RepID=A0AAJ6BEF2_9BACT|nr:MAG: hypothetical protein P0Y53_18695 [Pseudobacter sp.]